MTIEVTSGTNRPTAEEQITAALQDGTNGARLRVVVQIYDPKDKQYEQLRDTYWTISTPPGMTAGQVLTLVSRLGAAVAELGQP